MLLVAMLALGTATFAWFTTSTNPYADNFSAKTTKQSTLLLSDSSRTGWTSHLDYNVGNKTMYPASGNGTSWVKGTASNSLTGVIDQNTLQAVAPSPAQGVIPSDYLFAQELNLKNNGTADIKDVSIDFYLNTSDNKDAAEYARVALVPIDGTKVTADDYVALGNNVYSTTTKTYNPIIKTDGTEGTQISTKTTFHVDVTTGDEVMKPDEVRYYKLYVWFEGQDENCVDALSGQKIPVLIVTLSLTSKSSGVPNIFGIAPLSALTGSMEDTINTGDLIFCEVTDDPSYEYKKGDIVTFYKNINGNSELNTHRIVEVVKDDNITYYRTQGDNKKTNPEPDEELQTSSSIVAKYTGTKIGGVGNFLSFLRTQPGFFLCVLLPMIIFFVYEAIRVVLNLLAYNKEKTLEEAKLAVDSAELTEEQKKRAIEEYLASVGENQDKAENEPEVQTPADGNNSADNSD